MKKLIAMSFCAAMLAVLTGCTSVATTTRLNDMRMGTPKTNQLVQIHTEIWGVYLFGFIPLFAGNASNPGSTAAFSDTVRLDYSMLLATNAARNMDATKIEAVNSHFSSSTIFPIFLTMKSFQVSLTASK